MPEPGEPGTKETLADVENGFDDTNLKLMFPSFSHRHASDFFVLNLDGKCGTTVTVDYNVNFATIATDAHSVKNFVDAAKSFIDVKKFSPVTVIDVFDKAADTFDEVINRTSAYEHQQFYLKVNPCCPKKNQWYRVELEFDTRWLVNDKTGNNDYAILKFILLAGGLGAEVGKIDGEFGFTGPSFYKISGNRPYHSTVFRACEFHSDGPFTISVGFDEDCHVNWSPNPTPWIAGIKFNHIRLAIKTSSTCEDVAATAVKPAEEKTEPPKAK